ncbi:MAG: cell division protein ZapA [Chitinophagales bacterium]
MENKDLININLLIADRPYPLKIKPEEEEMVRKVAKEINEKVKQFQNRYAAKDKQDYLAMCALMMGVEKASNAKNKDSLGTEVAETIDDIESLINSL